MDNNTNNMNNFGNFSPEHQIRKEKIIFIAEIIGLVLIVLLVLFMYSKNHFNRIDNLKVPVVMDGSALDLTNYFEGLDISAHSAAVWDTKNQKFIYKKNEKDILPLASLTKLMTAMAAVEILPQESTIRIAQEYLVEENGAGLLANEKWKASDLVAFTLLTSSNVGSRALATVAGAFLPKDTALSVLGSNANPRELFIAELNRRAGNLGLRSMTFYNDSGLDLNEGHAGAYGSAEDVVKLSNYILENHPELLEPTRHAQINFVSTTKFKHDAKNTNKNVESIPGVVSSKTGYTDLAQGNLMVTFSPALDGPYIAVVMGSTVDGRFTDIEKLVSATLKTKEYNIPR